MEVSNNTPITIDSLIKVASFFYNEATEFPADNVRVEIGLTPFKLRKLDEYLFFKQNPYAKKTDFTHTPKVDITIEGVAFHFYQTTEKEKLVYKLDENGNQYVEME